MVMAAAETNPAVTGIEKKSTRKPGNYSTNLSSSTKRIYIGLHWGSIYSPNLSTPHIAMRIPEVNARNTAKAGSLAAIGSVRMAMRATGPMVMSLAVPNRK